MTLKTVLKCSKSEKSEKNKNASVKSTKSDFTCFWSERISPSTVVWLLKNPNSTIESSTLLLSAHFDNFQNWLLPILRLLGIIFGNIDVLRATEKMNSVRSQSILKFLQNCCRNPSEHKDVLIVDLSSILNAFATYWSWDSRFRLNFNVAQIKGWLWASRVRVRTMWNLNPFVFRN